jgi:glycosyltransferase involved in cell wall biosynthesis
MHILHVIESLEFGGAEKVVVHLANRLIENNQISICLTKREGPLVTELDQNIKVYFLDAGEGNNWSIPRQIKNIVTENAVDVIHSHNWSVYLETSIAALLLPKVRLIHTIHGKYMSYGSGLASVLKIKIRHFLEFILSQRSFKIISVSDSIKKYIGREIGIWDKKCMTIRNGIKPIAFLDKTKVTQSTTRFVTVGRLARVKNQKLMILAFENALI